MLLSIYQRTCVYTMFRLLTVFVLIALGFNYARATQNTFDCIQKRFSKSCVHSTDLYGQPGTPILLGMYGRKFEKIFEYDRNEDSCLDAEEWKKLPNNMRSNLRTIFC